MLGRILNITIFLIGLALLAFGAYLFTTNLNFVTKAERVTGKVIGLNEDDETTCLVIAFQTRKGQPVQFQEKSCSSSNSNMLNKNVVVLYDPANPANVRRDLWINHWLGATLTGGAGLLIVLYCVFGLVSFLFWLRRRPESSDFVDKLDTAPSFEPSVALYGGFGFGQQAPTPAAQVAAFPSVPLDNLPYFKTNLINQQLNPDERVIWFYDKDSNTWLSNLSRRFATLGCVGSIVIIVLAFILAIWSLGTFLEFIWPWALLLGFVSTIIGSFSKPIYFLTTRQAYVFNSFGVKQVYTAAKVENYEVQVFQDGSQRGNLVFDRLAFGFSKNSGGFMDIPNIARVHEMARLVFQAQNELKERSQAENLQRLQSLNSESGESPLRQIEPDLRQRLLLSLEPGEEIVWTGKPLVELAMQPKAWNDPSRLATLQFIGGGFVLTVVFTLVFSAFNWAAMLFLGGFYVFVIGIGAFSTLINPAKRRQKNFEAWSNKFYVLTNRRIFVGDDAKTIGHTALKNVNLSKEKLKINTDGSGSLTYNYVTFDDGSEDGTYRVVGFEFVPNVQEARSKLHQVKAWLG